MRHEAFESQSMNIAGRDGHLTDDDSSPQTKLEHNPL
jgi:hypothetical protein